MLSAHDRAAVVECNNVLLSVQALVGGNIGRIGVFATEWRNSGQGAVDKANLWWCRGFLHITTEDSTRTVLVSSTRIVGHTASARGLMASCLACSDWVE